MRHSTLLALLAGLVLGTATRAAGADASLGPTDSHCEYLVSPLGIDDAQPRLSWRLEAVRADTRGQRQTAYRILVASRRSLLEEGQTDRWDSGRVEFDGEEYDARRELPGWAAAGYDDAAWKPVQLVQSPGGQLAAQMLEPIRVTEVLQPQQVLEAKPGVWMVDFGQAFYGVVQLRTSGPAGTRRWA